MSSRARRAAAQAVIAPFSWDGEPATAPASGQQADTGGSDEGAVQQHLATLERDAFAKGFAQGERAGAEAAAKRGEAMLRRLTQTLEEVAELRTRMIHETEHQMVRLALAIARRVVHREVTLDSDLLVAIARVAMDRLGDSARITVRLNPDDFSATAATREREWAQSQVTVVADPRIQRGGCRIESDFGAIDAGVDAQLQELAQTLLSDSPAHGDR